MLFEQYILKLFLKDQVTLKTGVMMTAENSALPSKEQITFILHNKNKLHNCIHLENLKKKKYLKL